jgi:hypothetical protein
MMIKDCFSGVYNEFVPDKRLRARLEKTMSNLIHKGTSVINKLVDSHTEKIGIYRMLSNDRFDYSDLLEASHKKCADAIDVKHVLAIQDTTEFNYQGIKKKLGKEDSDIGPTGINTIAGYFCHPVLVMNPQSNCIYGISSTIFYNRVWDKKNKNERKYSQQPIEEKESFRWIKSGEETKNNIDSSVEITLIGDRESDIYEEFCVVPNDRLNLLVRSRCDRNLANGGGKLYATLESEPVSGSYEIQLASNKKRAARKAKIEIKYCQVSIAAPSNYKGETKEVTLWGIEARESEETKPKDDEGILWRLLTTHEVKSVEQAIECVSWYKKRWFIEELFRVIKTKGFQIESSQLASGLKLKKLLAMTLEAALHVMKLKLALTQDECLATTVFSEEEQEFIEVLQTKVEGATLKQKNPYPKKTLAWAAWTIARVAGWTGYSSHGPPGYITIKEGYDRFHLQLEGYLLFKNKS